MDKLAIFIIIALAITVVVLFVKLNKEKLVSLLNLPLGSRKEKKEKSPFKERNPFKDVIIPMVPDIGKYNPKKHGAKSKNYVTTIHDSRGFIEQINAQGEIIETYEIPFVGNAGVCIQKEGDDHILNELTVFRMDQADTISSDAYYILYDESADLLYITFHDDIVKDGYIYKNVVTGRQTNHMYYRDEKLKKTVPSESFHLTDGLLFCLGKQWFRFIAAALPEINPDVFGKKGTHKSEAIEPSVHAAPPAPPAPPVFRKASAPARTFADKPDDGTKTYPPTGRF